MGRRQSHSLFLHYSLCISKLSHWLMGAHETLILEKELSYKVSRCTVKMGVGKKKTPFGDLQGENKTL